MEFRFVTKSLLASIIICLTSACTFPSLLRGTYISSNKGVLEFAESSFSGWTVYTFGTFTFTCQLSSGTQYVVKSQTFNQYGLFFNAYLCLDISQVTRVTGGELFKFYTASAQESQVGNERVVVWLNSLTLSAMSDICTVTDYSTLSHSLLMKNGSIDAVKTKCPIPFLGNFAYTYDTGTGDLCSSNETSLTVCDDKMTLTFNYSKCSQVQAYSVGGVVSCVYYNETSDGNYMVHVYNQDSTTDESTTYRFTCYVVSGYATGYATQSPQDCQVGQNSTYVPSGGAALVLSGTYLCAYDYVAGTEVLSAGAIAAIIIGCFLLLVVVVVGISFHFYKKRQKQKEKERFESLDKKVDPDDLSPNMRLGLPNESKYDLDRLMYSPDPTKNGVIMNGTKRNGEIPPMNDTEGYHDGRYMDENQRQTAIDAHLFTEKRKRRDAKDEFKTAVPQTKQVKDHLKDIAKGRIKARAATSMGKLRLRPHRSLGRAESTDQDGNMDGISTTAKDIVIQVEEANTENKRKARFADDPVVTPLTSQKAPLSSLSRRRSKGNLEGLETLSDIPDNDMAVDDLESDEGEKEPRLILPNLKPKDKKPKRKRPNERFFLGPSQPTQAMPLNTRFMPPKNKLKEEPSEEPISVPLVRTNPSFQSMPPLARIHRKKTPKLWQDAFGSGEETTNSSDLAALKKRMSENRWKKLLEELYADKKYLDYVQKTKTNTETEIFTSADDGLQYLYGRAMFWEQQQPIPPRPSSTLKRMYSRHENGTPASSALRRSATSATYAKRAPRTPSTQVSRLRQRNKSSADKRTKDEENSKQAAAFKEVTLDHTRQVHGQSDGGTETESVLSLSVTPHVPGAITPVSYTQRLVSPDFVTHDVDDNYFNDDYNVDRLSMTAPITKEVTKSDIKLEEFDEDLNHEIFGSDDEVHEDMNDAH